MDNSLEGEFILNNSNTTASQTTSPSNPKDGPNQTQNVNNAVQNALHKPHPFTSYCHFPNGVEFEDQQENEQIILLIRRHFITNFPWIFFVIILVLLPVIFPFILTFFPFPLPSIYIQSLFLFSYYLVLFGFTLLNFTLWYFHVSLATTLRVIDVDINGILYREVSEARIEDIQDVSYNQTGFIRSLFNYGNVLMQTAGSIQNIEFDRVPRPSTIAQIIGDLAKGNE